ncbi:MAG TPA: hypothetical protein VFW47_01310 [Phenylobacterium sp.]|nr:hypothetical protein [Phenylobacterium sp.]
MTSASTRIWTRSTHHSAFRSGGWAYVRAGAQGEPTGQAGGERNTRPERMALAGLAASCKDLPAGAIEVELGDAALVRMVRTIAAGQAFADDEAPSADLDLWAQLATALKGRTATFRLADRGAFPGNPGAFAQAWADLAMDKAKAAGAFTASIPRPNLAKLKLD